MYILLLVNLIQLKAFAQDGTLDLSFGISGKVNYNLGRPYNEVKAVAIQNDRKIVSAGILYNGSSYRIILTRHNTNGSLDNTFDGDGKVITSVGTSCQASSIVILSNGKIMVGGYAQNSTSDMIALRYNSNGSLDNTFDDDGIASVDFGTNDYAYSLKIQSDGKVVLGGTSYNSKYKFALARLKTDGSLDTQFDGDGMLTTEISSNTEDIIQEINIQSNDKIVAVGSSRVSTTYDIVINRYNGDGTLDNSFDGDGMAIIKTGKYSIPTGTVLQIDEKILVCGYTYDTISRRYKVLLARWNTDGKPDPDFDQDGILTTAIDSGNTYALDIKVQNDNKIVVCGYSDTGKYRDVAVLRYNFDGSLDAGFGQKGIVMTQFTLINFANSLAIQSDGKIMIGGLSINTTFPNFVNILGRFNSDGSLDKTFDSDGRVYTEVGSGNTACTDMVLQKDGKILVFGEFYQGLNTGNNGIYDMGVTRFNANGSLDTSFRRTTFSILSKDIGTCIGLQSDGKVIIAGYSNVGTGRSYAHMARVTGTGRLDSSFRNALIPLDSGNIIQELTVQKDDKIVAVGTTYTNNKNWFSVLRFFKDGRPDTTFGTKGIVRTGFAAYSDEAMGVAIQKDGKIVVAGYSSNGTKFDMAIARYNADGSLDNTFNGDGKVTVAISNESSFANSLAIQEDGKIVLAGSSATGVNADFALARLNIDGSLDNTFDKDGMLTTTFRSAIERCYDVLIQPDGKILATGYSNLGTGLSSQFALARYLNNGVLDKSFDGDGKLLARVGNGNDLGLNSLLQQDGKIISVGIVSTEAGTASSLIRFNNKINVGVHKVADDDKLLIYPNPSSGIFNLDWKGSSQAEIEVFSITGLLVYENSFMPQIDLSTLSKGMYIIKVKEGDLLWLRKIVLE